MAVIREEVTINNKQFIKNYSDQNFYIEREDARYVEAIDPIELAADRIYTETDIPIEHGPKIEEEEVIEDVEQQII